MTSTQDTSLHLSLHFNSHAHVERDVQRTNRSHKTRISTHTLTWSVTLPSFSHSFSLKNFNSHAHVERDGTHQKTIITEEDFNSHAHVERDDTMVVMLSISRISTHTLTWSVTKTRWLNVSNSFHFNSHAHVERDYLAIAAECWCEISTHTLTWSVTKLSDEDCDRLAFQLTRSRGAWLNNDLVVCWQFNFNSHAHVERDKETGTAAGYYFISTHTLTWSVTYSGFATGTNYQISTHTLTWSVTQSTGSWFNCTKHFNSHAHVERDVIGLKTGVFLMHFNSHAHVERDYNNWNHWTRYWRFQLTRSRGAWLFNFDCAFVILHFNSHAHVERDQQAECRSCSWYISTHTLTWSVTLHHR